MPVFQAVVLEKVDEAMRMEKEREREFRAKLRQSVLDFEGFRQSFLDQHRHSINKGLRSVFAGVALDQAPLSHSVKARFMRAYAEASASVVPAFHGTNAANYPSIFNRGLLVPGQGNELRIVNGAAHGTGIYTANVDAALLSRGFCSEQSMLVCAVIHTGAVRHRGDAMIVPTPELVAPFFLATRGKPAPTKDNVLRVVANAPGAQTGASRALKDEPSDKAASKSSKFKASLAAKSKKR